jgi:hypothetical protein
LTQLSNFRFKSFRTHKLIEEDYGLITVDEPEELPMIKTTNLIHENQIDRDGIELVAIS